MKPIIAGLCAALSLWTAPAAHAQQLQDEDAIKLALATKIITRVQTQQMTDALGAVVEASLPAVVEGLTEAQSAEIRTLMVDSFSALMPRMFDAMAPVYADIFTIEELRGLNAFYESDLGRALLDKTFVALPRINAASQAVVMDAMPGIMTRVGDRLCVHLKCTPDQRREMKAAMAAALPPL